MEDRLAPEERSLLLKFARQAIQHAVKREKMVPLDLDALPPRLRQKGATFVTLTEQGELRGCIGALEAYQPLAKDVCEHAIAAALQDYRFPPVRPEDVSGIEIEISRLTKPVQMTYEDTIDLIKQLRPGIDGVILQDGLHRATFLPQVWEKLPDPEMFLSHLCQKMGAYPELWRTNKLQIFTYQVEEFHE